MNYIFISFFSFSGPLFCDAFIKLSILVKRERKKEIYSDEINGNGFNKGIYIYNYICIVNRVFY